MKIQMKVFKKTTQILMIILSLFLLQNCGSSSEKIEDEQLSSFMLGGIYFFNGYGGVESVEKMMSGAGYSSNEELVQGYKEILEFPFQSSQADGIKSMFRNMWDVTDKTSLLETLEDLKTRNANHKSWDYARIVNNSCMGYAAGWLTKEEVISINKEILPLAREKYNNWNDYFKDFDKGRVAWDANDPQAASFEVLAKNIAKGEKSIYTILPLNTLEEK